MATISKFEDLIIWQLSRKMDKAIFKLTCRGDFAKDFSLKDQIRRSSGSVMDNIAEGFGRGGNKEFIKFLGISRGSNSEVRSQLYRAKDREYINEEEFDHIYQLSVEINNKTNKFMAYLQSSNIKGTQNRFGEQSNKATKQQSNQ